MDIGKITARFENGEFKKAIQRFKEITIPLPVEKEIAISLSKTLEYLENGNTEKALRELLGRLVPLYDKEDRYKDLVTALDLASSIYLDIGEYCLAHSCKQKALFVLSAQPWCYTSKIMQKLIEVRNEIFAKWRGS